MTSIRLEDILVCPGLPSLPAVAVRLLELTSDPDVAMSDISKLVQQDQALAAKVLKTVNSSFYGLSTPCGSIDRAMGYLGLNTVKSLVLGFSLVETMKDAEHGFDLESHWRRAILGATAARMLAMEVGGVDPEDAFTASLFQDIGVLVFCVTVKDRYAEIMTGTPHREICEHERKALGFDHALVGSEMASKWKLPVDIVEAIRYHHHPEDCVSTHQAIVRVVALGTHVSACLDHDASPTEVRAYETLAERWYDERAPKPDQLFNEVAETGKTLAKLFGQSIGSMPSAAALISLAQEKSVEHQLNLQRQAEAFKREALVDGLTQVANRKRFDTEMKRVFDEFVSDQTPFGVLFFDADRFKSVNDTYGHTAGDVVLVELAKRTQQCVGSDGMVFRYGGEEFAVLVQGKDLDFCAALAEQVRASFDSTPFDLSEVDGVPDTLDVTASIGVSSTDAGVPGRIKNPEHVVQEADECVYAAKSDGRNNVKVFGRFNQVMISDPGKVSEVPASVKLEEPAKAASTQRILLIEDDALAATLVISLLKRRGNVEVDWMKSGTRACMSIEAGDFNTERAPQLVLCDFNLPGCDGHEVLRVVRENGSLVNVPFFMLTGNNDTNMRDESIRRGATKFIHKDEFCADVNRWLGTILGTNSIAA